MTIKKTTFELKNELKDFNMELEKKSSEILELATANDAAGVEKLENEIRSLETCKQAIEKELSKRETIIKNSNITDVDDPKEKLLRAKALFIRSSFTGERMPDELRDVLGALPGNKTNASNFMPVNMANELLCEPLATNPLRGNSMVTSIKGLVLPKISFSIDDDAFIDDTKTAKEIKLEGDQVIFGKNKFKVKSRISDTTLHGSDLSLVGFVENALRSGLAAKEKKVAFDTTKDNKMSFYGSGILEVEGNDLYTSIKKSIADLHEDYRENAKICMKYADYIDLIEKLANGSTTLYGVQPEQILGKPVIFCDNATTPVIGDFSYSHFNYDGEVIYDTDKDIDKGEYLFVLTGWFDHKIKLKSAFRLAKVKAGAKG